MTEPMSPEEFVKQQKWHDNDTVTISELKQRDITIRQSERAKQKEIENELDEATNLLIESNNLLKQHLPTIKNYEDQITGLLNLLAEIESSGYLKEKITYNETELEGRVRSALTKFNNEGT